MTEQRDRSASGGIGGVGRIGIIGAGALGVALARALALGGGEVAAVAMRDPERDPGRARALAAALPGTAITVPSAVVAACDLVFLAVPDDAIAPLAASLAWRDGQGAIHLSGAHGAELLAPAAAQGAATAALHPLMTFPRADLAEQPAEDALARFHGCSWALEAENADLDARLAQLVAALGGQVIRLWPTDRVAYHAAAVLASNYVIVLLDAATRLWASFGVAEETALQALLPLARAAVGKLEADGLPGALSGPIARGDVGTVAAHLAWLDAQAIGDAQGAALRDAYRALARLAIPLAEAKGTLSAASAARLRLLLA
ncbi:MAG: DUF2520 domain-containing protein [Ktedonobacterales bacterium]|nr:DUF2520 domain-containing protein [Ktedonobacterales bacterium]